MMSPYQMLSGYTASATHKDMNEQAVYEEQAIEDSLLTL